MTEEWKVLTDAQKEDYVAASNREKERYEREMKVYKAKKANEQKAAASGDVGEKIVGKKRGPSKSIEPKAPSTKKSAAAAASTPAPAPAKKGAAAKKQEKAQSAPAKAGAAAKKPTGKAATAGKKKATPGPKKTATAPKGKSSPAKAKNHVAPAADPQP